MSKDVSCFINAKFLEYLLNTISDEECKILNRIRESKVINVQHVHITSVYPSAWVQEMCVYAHSLVLCPSIGCYMLKARGPLLGEVDTVPFLELLAFCLI